MADAYRGNNELDSALKVRFILLLPNCTIRSVVLLLLYTVIKSYWIAVLYMPRKTRLGN